MSAPVQALLMASGGVGSLAMLMHMDGTDGSTTFTEVTGKSVIVGGSSKIKTAQSVFGGASAYLDGAGDYLSIGAASDISFLHAGVEDWTLDIWAYPETTGATRVVLETGGVSTSERGIHIGLTNAGVFDVTISKASGGTYAARVTSAASAVPNGSFTHLRVVVASSVLYTFAAGTLIGSNALSSPSGGTATRAMTIGRYVGGGSLQYKGYLDEFRIVRGVALTTSGFTPPASPFADTYP